MPSGRRKRLAARRRSIGATTRTSLDKESVSGSHVSDEGTSPRTSEEVNTRLSVTTGTSERPSETFHTEEWVRVSDFNVGTPTSPTAKSDFDAAAEDSYGDAQAQDKLVDWETISRDNAGNSSSAEDVGEAENIVAKYALGSGQAHGQKSSQVDKVPSGSSDEKDDDKSVSGRSDGGKSSRSSSSSSSRSSRSTVHSTAAFPKKSEDEERSSSIVVVPSHEEDSQESSFAEVASVEARDDDYHGIVTHFSSPEAKELEQQASSAIEPVSSDEQEEGKYESFGGVEDQTISTIEPISSDDEEEEKYRLFTDVSNLKELLQQEGFSNDPSIFPSHFDNFSSFLASRVNEPANSESEAQDSSEVTDAKIGSPRVFKEEHQAQGLLGKEEREVSKAKEVSPETPELKESEKQVIQAGAPDSHVYSLSELRTSDQDGEDPVQGLAEHIEPTTPEKASEKSSSGNPYAFVRSISDEEISEHSNPSGKIQGAASEKSFDTQEVDEHIAKAVQDAPVSNGVPEPDQHELNQLLDVAHSKEIANLGKQEEKLLLQEEQDLGKGIIEPLGEVLSAVDDSRPLEGGELKELQPVVSEEAPLLKDSSGPDVPGIHIEAELKNIVPELYNKESEDELHDETNAGVGDEHQPVGNLVPDKTPTADSFSKIEEPRVGEVAGKEAPILESKTEGVSAPSVEEHVLSIQIEQLAAKNEDATLVPLSNISDSGAFIKDAGVTSSAGAGGKSAENSRAAEKSEQLAIAPNRKIEEQGRRSQASSDAGGCCAPVQWLFASFTAWVSPRSIRN